MRIYTKQGDKGESVLFDGQRVPKHHLRLETYGTLDELNCHLGLAVSTCRDSGLGNQLRELQRQIFDLGADLATPLGSANESKVRRIDSAEVSALEKQIDEATARVSPLKTFILPGGSMVAGHLHVARTVCRRAERALSALMGKEAVGDQPLIYVNRLSDLLFTLARLANALEGIGDVTWKA